MLKKLKKLLNPQLKPFGDFPYRIVPAFEMAGLTYYEVENVFNTPCMRALAAIAFYEEVRMKCTAEYLDAWSAAHGNVIKEAIESLTAVNGKVNLATVGNKLNDLANRNYRLQERLKLSVDLDNVYKLASVIYFDDTENPYQYELQYGMKKIEFWKKHEGAEAFFLRVPIKKLVPYLDGQGENIRFYQEVVNKVKLEDMKEVLSNLSSEQNMKYTTLISSLKKVG